MSKSTELFTRAQGVLPGGVSRNTLLRDPHPLYVSHGQGCKVTDVDGVERLDFANNMASLIHGHAHPAMVEAISAQLARGTAFTMATEAEIIYAEHLCSRAPGFDKIRFVNSGTEAVMAGVKAARAYTNRPKIVKAEGTYHGAYDYVEVSQAPGPDDWGDAGHPKSVPLAVGTPDGIMSDVVVIPYNDIEASLSILDEHQDDIACVLIDPIPHRVGLIPADQPFVKALREWATANGALLMFDEVITFRSEVGGMQQRYGVQPDLTSMGKVIGGGFPVGALAGCDDVMDVFVSKGAGPRLPHSGTFSANPVTMTAGRIAMELYDAEAVTRLNGLGDMARSKLEEAIKIADVPGSVTGAGSLFRLHLKSEPPRNYRSTFPTPAEKKALSQFINGMYDEGIMMVHTAMGVLSTPMGEAEIDRLAEAVLINLRTIREVLLKEKN
ncbi:MAG: aspartate aminotransferase family protein [Rhodospirillales bacterium]|jgi:glutamate-1-semialdehyde 2,1-aminomutase|nr:aspartate aminotransferase family protein [Rhodospirillales bacterium]